MCTGEFYPKIRNEPKPYPEPIKASHGSALVAQTPAEPNKALIDVRDPFCAAIRPAFLDWSGR